MTDKPLVIQYLAVRGAYEWFCRRCNHTAYTSWLWEAEHDGFDHVRKCRG